MHYSSTASRVLLHNGMCKSRLREQAVGKKSARLRARTVRKGVVLAAVGIALSLLFVWTRVRVIQLGYEVSQINRQVSELLVQKNIVEDEVAKLKSPERLELMAKKYFQMRLPQGHEIVFLKTEGDK